MDKKAAINLDINVGDVLLGGRYKNKYIKVKSIGTDELGQPIINKDRKLLSVRIEKKLPEKMWSSKTLANKYKDKEMDKKALLEEVHNSAFNNELEKIALVSEREKKIIGGGTGTGALAGIAYGLGKSKRSGKLKRAFGRGAKGAIVGAGASAAYLVGEELLKKKK